MSVPPRESALLRVYTLRADRVDGGERLAEAIVRSARAAGLAGATALNAKMGFASGGRFFTDASGEVGFDQQPVVVELVDARERLQAFLPALHALVRGRRLVTLERAEVLHYAPGGS
ncbi:MAG TPA: DUF190 domain-containing protein [Deinococcales bacterium]|nr:DUF190 domain-containing protein [Deinococcales bacterium]